jgi:DnaJ-class molecular chaperone
VPGGEALPRTRQEALEVLGMGIGPEVNEAAIKKIIDGLRLSWHPDHARDADDRVQREQRLKQINAAWDIIADKRAVTRGPSA